jgi:hypothetical protein
MYSDKINASVGVGIKTLVMKTGREAASFVYSFEDVSYVFIMSALVRISYMK